MKRENESLENHDDDALVEKLIRVVVETGNVVVYNNNGEFEVQVFDPDGQTPVAQDPTLG